MKRDIILSGVGGQGILSIATVIGKAALTEGLHIKQAEVHGMSQRGGSVVTYVRYGDKEYSPIIQKGQADLILVFEQLEAARWLPYLKVGGKIIANNQKIDPMPVITGAAVYPDGVLDAVRATGADLIELDALSLAVKAGSAKAVNVVLIGVMASHMDIAYDVWTDAIRKTVPEKFLEMNLKAFDYGYHYSES